MHTVQQANESTQFRSFETVVLKVNGFKWLELDLQGKLRAWSILIEALDNFRY